MEVSSIHPIIVSDDAKKTVEFYESLGFKTKHETIMTVGAAVYIVANNDAEIEIMESPKNAPVQMPAGLYGLRINVDDLDEALETVTKNGGTIVGGPFDTEWTRVYAVKDADGNNITLMKHIKK